MQEELRKTLKEKYGNIVDLVDIRVAPYPEMLASTRVTIELSLKVDTYIHREYPPGLALLNIGRALENIRERLVRALYTEGQKEDHTFMGYRLQCDNYLPDNCIFAHPKVVLALSTRSECTRFLLNSE